MSEHWQDESTPLLPTDGREIEQTDSQRLRTFRGLTPQYGLGSGHRIAIYASRSANKPGFYDNSDLSRHRSRLSSYSVVHIPEHLKEHEGHAGHVESGNAEDNEGLTEGGRSTESKYMGVSATRFWLIFLSILIGMLLSHRACNNWTDVWQELTSRLAHTVGCFDVTLMASSHPVITSAFNASNEASWLTTSFLITSTGTSSQIL